MRLSIGSPLSASHPENAATPPTNRRAGWRGRLRAVGGRLRKFTGFAASAPPRSARRDALHLLVWFSFAFAEPMYDRLERQAIFLADKDFAAVLLFIGMVSLVVPALAIALECLVGRYRAQWREIVHLGFVFACSLALWLMALRRSGLSSVETVPLSLAGSGVVLVLYRAWRALDNVLLLCTVGVFIFPATLIVVYERNQPPLPIQTLTARNPVPVVFVVFDEFCGMSLLNANREIDEDRFPNFAKLSRTSTWYRNASSVHPRTDHAVPAILTGNYPRQVRLPTLAQYPTNLFTLLGATGQYNITAFEPFTSLYPRDVVQELRNRRHGVGEQVRSLMAVLNAVYLRDLFPDDFMFELPDIPKAWYGLRETLEVDREQRVGAIRYNWSAHRSRQFEHFLECLEPSEVPRFGFLHIVLPHAPWCYLPSGRLYREDAGLFSLNYIRGVSGVLHETWANDELVVNHGQQQYLLQVGYVDHLLGRLMGHLRSVGLWNKCLLVVMADHGVSFRAGTSRRIPNRTRLADIMSVPLFVKYPYQTEGTVSDRTVETIDVLPTVLDVIGLKPPGPQGSEGQSLLKEFDRPYRTFINDGKLLTEDAAFESKYLTLQNSLGRFGSGKDPLNLYRIGPHRELVGKRVASLHVGPKSTLAMTCTGLLGSVDDPRTPGGVYLEGLLETAPPNAGPVELAIAVNGTIVATTRTYLVSGLRDLWTAMLPESAFSPERGASGSAEVQIYVCTSGKEEVVLHPWSPSHAAARNSPETARTP